MTEKEEESKKESNGELNKKVQLAMAALDKEFGTGTVMRLGTENIAPLPFVSTGAFSLDIALGIGGLPLGRIVEIYGPESSGKSTVCLSVIAEAQEQDMTCLYIDTEHAIDPQYAKDMGVNMDDLIFSQPDYGEQAMKVLLQMVSTGEIGVAIIDSVAALVPKAELDGEVGDSHMGLQARLMSQTMRKLVALANETKTLIIFTNQLRDRIGVFFGNPETTTGGKALRFYSSVRIDLRKREDIKDSEGFVIGSKIKAKIIKNKTAPPLKITEFDIHYGKGVDNIGCLVDEAVKKGVLEKSGAWIKYQGESFSQGRQKAIDALASDLDLADEIKTQVLES